MKTHDHELCTTRRTAVIIEARKEKKLPGSEKKDRRGQWRDPNTRTGLLRNKCFWCLRLGSHAVWRERRREQSNPNRLSTNKTDEKRSQRSLSRALLVNAPQGATGEVRTREKPKRRGKKIRYLQPKPISLITMKFRSKKCPPGGEGYAFFRTPQDRSHAFEATENMVHRNLLQKERKK